jgi:thiol-disulfide isomerase/thioredoxin
MNRLFAVGILFCLFFLRSQSQNIKGDTTEGKGILFENSEGWQEILQKAKAENKYIFVDCYASWCGPCKLMDQYVYSKDTVGMIVNKDFISVRLQMDTALNDEEDKRKNYGLAHSFEEQYDVKIYPSFLFFSPDGHAVHKAVGAKRVPDFLPFFADAQNPRHQFYTVLSQYQQANKNYSEIPWLCEYAKEIGEDSLSSSIARDYLYNHLVPQSRNTIWAKDNLDFISLYKGLLHLGDPLFIRYFADRNIIDSILGGPGKSSGVIGAVVYQDGVLPYINKGIQDAKEPDWGRIEKAITKRYGYKYAGGNLLKGRIEYYKAKKEWASYSRYFVIQTEAAKPMSWPPDLINGFILNNDAFEVFQYSFDRKDLEKALTWVDRSLTMNKNDPQALDTKANLLYKLGRKEEALTIEQQSNAIAPRDNDIQTNYNKMKSGLPTWDVNASK